MTEMIPCPWCRDGTMMGGTASCLICDGRQEVEKHPAPPDPETQQLLDAIDTHCREWREYFEANPKD